MITEIKKVDYEQGFISTYWGSSPARVRYVRYGRC